MKVLERERVRAKMSKAQLGRLSNTNPAVITWAEQRGFQMYPVQLSRVADALGWPIERAVELLEDVVEDARD